MKRYTIVGDYVVSEMQADTEEQQIVEDENGEFIYYTDAEDLLADTTVLKSKLTDLETIIDRLEKTITTLSAKVVKAKEALDGR